MSSTRRSTRGYRGSTRSSTRSSSSLPAASPNSDANAGPNAGENSGLGDQERPRLTEQEKKANHIASEQKRRQTIREAFDRLTLLVPGIKGMGRSENIVLVEAIAFIKKLWRERLRLIAELEKHGKEIPPKYWRSTEDIKIILAELEGLADQPVTE